MGVWVGGGAAWESGEERAGVSSGRGADAWRYTNGPHLRADCQQRQSSLAEILETRQDRSGYLGVIVLAKRYDMGKSTLEISTPNCHPKSALNQFPF